MSKIPVGIIGATGMVGQRFITLLQNHPWFEVAVVAASPKSAGKLYAEAVAGRWAMPGPIPDEVAAMTVLDAIYVEDVSSRVGLVFCAVDMSKYQAAALEEVYARCDVAVVSANSAHRWTPDVPMIIPEVNPHHLEIIPAQRQRLRTTRGCIVVKPNCSIQPYVPALHALREFMPDQVLVCTYQALSGAGRTLNNWPEMSDNIIPFIGGEEEKSVREPLKIWGEIQGNKICPANRPVISAQCIRVPVSDGHLAAVSVHFLRKPAEEQILECWASFRGRPQELYLPSAPDPFLRYSSEKDRPMTRLDRDAGNGMAISLGRLREDEILGWKFIALAHNTIRGAAGGAILTAELLKAEGYLEG